eukprot:TRINITY_DN10713_c0_g1_i2.p1 TRINITY_DN10713_c0_g1~~TRINITY_DN10713_c0_g1_i2.p1  ORF type:complete len:620 (+),score=121.16 TRINITY_DN10713_c0_g1_i2:272-1861(+)
MIQKDVRKDKIMPEASTQKPRDICIFQDGQCFDWDLGGQAAPRPDSLASRLGKSASIVVTRAGEDVRWLDHFPDVHTRIYNRAGKSSLLPKARANLEVILQENVGREDQAMMQYIVDNYDSLPDVTVFLQGWPFLHCTGLVDTVHKSIANAFWHGVVPISGSFWQYSLPEGKLGLARHMAEIHHQAFDATSAKDFVTSMYNGTCITVLGGKNCPSQHWVAEGAQWAVTRERIRSTPLETYQAALALGEGWESKFRGLVLEAMWPVMWGESDWRPNNIRELMVDGFSTKHALSSDGHCQAPEKKGGLMWSCLDRMASCELQSKAQGAKSFDFLELRKDFRIGPSKPPEGSMDLRELLEAAPPLEEWSMVLELKPSFEGSTTWEPVERFEHQHRMLLPKLMLGQSNRVDLKLARNDTSQEEELPLRWKAVQGELGSTQLIFEADSLDANEAPKYLACGENDGFASLVQDATPWRIHPLFDGWVALESSQGFLSFSGLENSTLLCIHKDKHDRNFFGRKFMMELQEQADAAN